MTNILVTGGNSRFANTLKKIKSKYNFIFRSKSQLNINSQKSIKNNIKKFKPRMVLHLAGLSRPMDQHNKNINKSIQLNIMGTCNLVMVCNDLNVKLIYFSTNYLYPGTKGNYDEKDPLLPWNNYGWSKLGGESAVQMYNNSLILRVSMTEKPFIHKKAYANVKSNFIYQEDLANLFLKVINKKGIINIGGKTNTIFNFAKKDNINLSKIYSKGEFPKRMDMSLKKLNKILK